MNIHQQRATRNNRNLAILISTAALTFGGLGASATAEEKPTPFKFEILPSDKTCLEILPEIDPPLPPLKCNKLMMKEKADCKRAGGTVLLINNQTVCRTPGPSTATMTTRGGVKLPPKGGTGPTFPVGASLGTKAVEPTGGCVLRPGSPVPTAGGPCSPAK